MEVIDKRKIKTQSFLQVNIGETFNLLGCKALFMKVHQNNLLNAVNLTLNKLATFQPLDDVVIVKAEIHLK